MYLESELRNKRTSNVKEALSGKMSGKWKECACQTTRFSEQIGKINVNEDSVRIDIVTNVRNGKMSDWIFRVWTR